MKGWVLGTVLRRGRSQWAVFVVVAVVCLITSTLLATLAIQTSAAQRFGVPAELSRSTPAATVVNVDLTISGKSLGPAQQALDEGTRKLLGGVPFTSSRQLLSQGALVTDPLPASSSRVGSMVFYGAFDRVADHVRLTSGRWPAPAAAGGPVETVVPERLLTDFRISLGARFSSTDVSGSHVVAVVVVGTFRPVRPLDKQFWALDPLHGAGFDPNTNVPYTAGLSTNGYSPLLVDPSAFESGAVTTDILSVGQQPDLGRLSASEVDALAGRVDGADELISNATAAAAQRSEVFTTLGDVLDRVRRFRLMTEAAVIVIGSLLLVLAIAALTLATRLLTDRRAGEQSLMRARGASRRQLLRLATVEALIVALATAAVAPPLGRLLYLFVARQPGVAGSGLDRDPGLPLESWLTAGGAALLFVVILVAPLLRRPALFVEQEQARSRQDARGGLQRSGIDLAIVALAAVAYWQLYSYGTPLLGQGRSLRVDPVLVAGPALALLAGALVAVRVIPPVSGALERVGAAGRRIVLALAAWEVSRRPGRAAGAVLLITLALAVGTFGLSYLDTWRVSQQDQADFRAGTDARASFDALPPLAQASLVARLPGAAGAAPAVHRDAEVGRADDREFEQNNLGGSPVELIAVEGTQLAGLARGRTVEPGGENRALVDTAAQFRQLAPAGGVELPGDPGQISARVRLDPTSPEPSPDLPGSETLTVKVRLVVQDAAGVRDSVDLGTWPRKDGDTVTAPVPGAVEEGRTDPVPASERPRLSLPLRVVAVQTTWHGTLSGLSPDFVLVPTRTGITVDQLAVRDVTAPATAAPRPVTLPGSTAWHLVGLGVGESDATTDGGALLRAKVRFAEYGGGPTADSAGAVYTTWTPGAPVPAVVTDGLFSSAGLVDGDGAALRVGYVGTPVNVLATVPHLPGTGGHRPAVYVDAEALSRKLIEYGSPSLPLDEWWAPVPEARVDAFTAAVAQAHGTVVTRVGLRHELQEQPLRIGIQAALWLAVAAAGALAAVGFATHTTVAIRVRRTEFSQLRAIGLTRRRLTSVVATENLLLCAIGAVCGIGIGVLLGLLVGPLVAMAADGGSPVPSVAVAIPWLRVGLLATELVGLLAIVLVIVTRANRHRALGAVLRVGDER